MRQLAAILSGDIVGYSALMAEDEDSTVRQVTRYREQIELLVGQHRGRLMDFTGDNFLAQFGSAVAAVDCATEIQDVLSTRNTRLPDEQRMQFRLGLELGEVRTMGNRVFGTGVNVAARLQAFAQPGGLCISSKVRDAVGNRLGRSHEDLGEKIVKNIPEPVHVYRVGTPVEVETSETGSRRGRRAMGAAAFVVLLAAAAGWNLSNARSA